MNMRITESTHTSQENFAKSLNLRAYSNTVSGYKLSQILHQLPASTQQLLFYLTRYYYKERFTISIDRMVSETGLCKRTVERGIERLRRHQLIMGRQFRVRSVVCYKFVKCHLTPQMVQEIKRGPRSYDRKSGVLYNKSNTRSYNYILYTRAGSDRAVEEIGPLSVFMRLVESAPRISGAAFRQRIRTMCHEQLPRYAKRFALDSAVCESHLLFLLLHVDTLRTVAIPTWITPPPRGAAPPPQQMVVRLIGYIKKVIGPVTSRNGRRKYALMKRCASLAGFVQKPRVVVKKEKNELPSFTVSLRSRKQNREKYKQLLTKLAPMRIH